MYVDMSVEGRGNGEREGTSIETAESAEESL